MLAAMLHRVPPSFLTWSIPALLLGAATALYFNFSAMSVYRHKAEEASNALSQIEILVSTLKDAETGERGFLLTGEDAYLEPYERALSVLPGEMAAAAAFADSDPVRAGTVARIETLVQDRLAHLRRGIELRRGSGLNAERSITSGRARASARWTRSGWKPRH